MASSLAGCVALRLDDEGYVCLGPQRYRALVLYRPEFCGQPELEFFGRASLGKTAIFQVGEWTCDSEARPLKTAQRLGDKVRRCADDESCATAVRTRLGEASVPRVTGWNRNHQTHPLPPVDGLASLTDGTCIRAAGSRGAAGDPIRETFTWQGHAIEVDALGVVAIRFAADGRVAAFAAGGLKRVKTNGLDLELSERADLAFLRNADGSCAGVLQGLAGDVPAPLQAITPHWQRLAVPGRDAKWARPGVLEESPSQRPAQRAPGFPGNEVRRGQDNSLNKRQISGVQPNLIDRRPQHVSGLPGWRSIARSSMMR